MKTPFSYSSVKNLEIISKFKKNKNVMLNCPRHGIIGKWVFYKKFRVARDIYNTDHRIKKRYSKNQINIRKKNGYYDEYIKCPRCTSEYEKYTSIQRPMQHVLRIAKKHAIKKGLVFNLNKDVLANQIKKQKNKCAYTNIIFKKDFNKNFKKRIDSTIYSIDRINSKLGYLPNNIELVLVAINLMKQDLTKKEFIKLCKIIKNPPRVKGNLRLLKYAFRKKTKSQIKIDENEFNKGNKVLCYVHGYHRNFIKERPIQGEERGSPRKISFQCAKCYLQRKIRYKMKPRSQIDKEIKNYKNGKNIYCKKHKNHKEYLFIKTGAGGYLRCKKCLYDITKESHNNLIFSQIFTKSQTRIIKSNITYEDIIKQFIKQNGKCALTQTVFDTKKNKPSIDRIDPNYGYLKNNIQLTTYLSNRTKWNLNMKKFRFLITKITTHSRHS
tara:strand:+ start:103 stop:1419 length:1317 start_codon:yes stop_codon:yes gene_type:complete